MAAPIHVARQERADLESAIHALKAEARQLMAIKVKDRTPEQVARLDTIDVELETKHHALGETLADIQRLERYQDEERAQGSVAALEGDRLTLGEDRAAVRPWGPRLPAQASERVERQVRQAGLGEFAIAVYNASTGRGADPRLFAVATGMGSVNPADGGFAIPMEVAAGIEREMYETGAILSRVDARDVTGDSIAYNVVDETSRVAGSRQGAIRGYWVDQGTAPDASQTRLARVELKLRKVGALGYMTDELVADAAALGGELEAMFSEELIFMVEDAIFEGTGAGQPQGFTEAPCLVTISKETGQPATSINTHNLSKMWARLPARSKMNAVWLINVDVEPELDHLVHEVGTSGIPSRIVTYNDAGVIRIKGRDLVPVEYASTLGTIDDIVLVDLSRYRLIRKGGVQQASSIHVRFTQGEQTFRAFYRCDGQMMPRSAVTPFKGSNTVSPVITLATRA